MRRFRPVVLASVLALPFFLAAPGAGQEPEAAKPEVWEFSPGPQGIELTELIEVVRNVTGESVVYNPNDAALKNKKVFFPGSHWVPRDRVFDWFQSIMSYHKLVLAPIGPSDHRQWAVLNINDPSIANHPTHVDEKDLEEWKDRDGVYIVSVLTFEHLEDISRARNCLANLVTRPMGRVNDVPGGRAVVVGDFAPVVYAMSKLIKSMDRPGIPMPLTSQQVSQRRAQQSVDPLVLLEQRLASAQTETAARYFLERIEALRGEVEAK